MVAGFTKTFTAGPPDDQPVDPAVVGDNATARRVRFAAHHPVTEAARPRHARTAWCGSRTRTETSVPGMLTVGGGERVLTFAPKTPWRRGEYKLVADTRLEDVCGNRVGEPFEVDVFKPVTRTIETKTVERRVLGAVTTLTESRSSGIPQAAPRLRRPPAVASRRYNALGLHRGRCGPFLCRERRRHRRGASPGR